MTKQDEKVIDEKKDRTMDCVLTLCYTNKKLPYFRNTSLYC